MTSWTHEQNKRTDFVNALIFAIMMFQLFLNFGKLKHILYYLIDYL